MTTHGTSDMCTHGQRLGACGVCHDWNRAKPVTASAPPSVTVCRNCNKPISRSNSYGWLHIGGWFLCDNSEPQPFAEPTDNAPSEQPS